MLIGPPAEFCVGEFNNNLFIEATRDMPLWPFKRCNGGAADASGVAVRSETHDNRSTSRVECFIALFRARQGIALPPQYKVAQKINLWCVDMEVSYNIAGRLLSATAPSAALAAWHVERVHKDKQKIIKEFRRLVSMVREMNFNEIVRECLHYQGRMS